jgi:hypothetical protein
MKTKCLISSPSKEELKKAINKFYYSENYIITDDNRIYNTKLEKYLDNDSLIITAKKGRWQLRQEIKERNE